MPVPEDKKQHAVKDSHRSELDLSTQTVSGGRRSAVREVKHRQTLVNESRVEGVVRVVRRKTLEEHQK